MLEHPELFFKSVRQGILGPTLSPDEVAGCEAILAAMEGLPLSWTAYALATAYHETASTMQPIKEYGGPTYFTRMYDVTGARSQMAIDHGNTCAGDGPKYCGRGYVQLTWKCNYQLAKDKLGIDLITDPDKAMDPKVAANIMRYGMTFGWFTGKKFADYLPKTSLADRRAFTNARRIINGTDRASKIAEHALDFQLALEAGGWS